MDDKKWAQYEAEARRAAAMVFWEDLSQIVGFLISSWQTYVFALILWGLTRIF